MSLKLLSILAAVLGFGRVLLGCADDRHREGDDAGSSDVDAAHDALDAWVAPYDAGPVDAPLSPPVAFRVATWNAHDFFDAADDPATMDTVLTAAQARAKLADVAAAIATFDADLVVLEEVENAALIEALATGPLARFGYAQRGLVDGNDPRGIDVGYLSRVPIDFVRNHIHDRFVSPTDPTRTYQFARDAVEIAAHPVGAPRVLVFGIHFRSQLGDDNGEDYRLAEARYVRTLVDQRIGMGAPRVLVMGDFNDGPESPTLMAFAPALADTAEGIATSDRWTITYRGTRSQFDHVLGNPAMLNDMTGASIPHTAVTDTSDHDPVIVDFVLRR